MFGESLVWYLCMPVLSFSTSFQLELNQDVNMTFRENVATESGGGIYVEFPPIRFVGVAIALLWNYNILVGLWWTFSTGSVSFNTSTTMDLMVVLMMGLEWTRLLRNGWYGCHTH